MRTQDIRCGLCAVAATLVLSACQTPVPKPAATADDLVPVGQALVDAVARVVVVTGYVNQVEGPVELLACGPSGKTHESILVLYVDPVDLHAALLLLGARPGAPMKGQGLGPPEGAKLEIAVEWSSSAGPVRRRAQELIWDNKGVRPVRTRWIFNGSTFEKGRYMALSEDSLMATYWDPWSVVNMSSPLGADDDTIFARTALLPPLQTPVTVRISPR